MKNLHDNKLKVLESAWGSTYSQMASDFTFASGGEGMWDSTLHASRVAEDMTNISLPLLPPYIDKVVSGVRMSPPSMAVKTEDEELQEIINGVLRGIEKASTASSAYVGAMKCAVTAGLGWLFWAVETENGLPVLRLKTTTDPTAIMIDPLATYLDGRDAQYAVNCSHMDKDQAKELYGEEACQGSEMAFSSKMTFNVPSSAVLDCIWYIKEETGVRITRMIGNYEAYNQLFEGLDGLPIVPVIGEELLGDTTRRYSGLIARGREINENLNLTASNIMMLVAYAPKVPFVVDPRGIEGFSEWETANSRNHAYLRNRTIDPTTQQPIMAPYRLDNTAQTQGLQSVADWLQSLIGRTNGISDASLGGLETAMESGKSLIARMEQAESDTAMFVDNLMNSITQLARVGLQMMPSIYNGMRDLVIIDEYGQSSRMGVDLGLIMTPEIVQMLDVEIGAGPHMEMKRKASSVALETMVSALGPERGIGLMDIWAESQPLSDKQRIKKRMEKLMPPELQDQQEGDIPPEAMAMMQEAEQALAQKTQNIEALKGMITQLQAKVESQEVIAQVELEKASISAQTKIMDREMQNDNNIRKELIKQGSEDQRLSAKLTADEQRQVDEFQADLIKQKEKAIQDTKNEVITTGIEQTAKIPRYLQD